MKTIAILLPTYKRFNDLKHTLENTYINHNAKFIIVANLEDAELSYIQDKFGNKSIIIDERKYGRMGGGKAYNLAFETAKNNKFDYAILFADDVIPFKRNWLNKLYKEFVNIDGSFGIFSSDECHHGHYGWNFILDCPIAHFFIIDCSLVDQLFLESYKQYVIDFEIAVRLKEQGIDIQLLPIKLNHLRSGLHREFMDNNYNEDLEIFLSSYPKYETSFRQIENVFFLKDLNTPRIAQNVEINKLVPWSALTPPKSSLNVKLKRALKRIFR